MRQPLHADGRRSRGTATGVTRPHGFGKRRDQAQALPRQALFNAGQWQNRWDDCLAARRSGIAIDPLRAVRRLSRGEPLRRLERKQRKSWNHQTVLILERSQDLRPIWDDLDDAKTTLTTLLGREQLSTYVLACGPDGLWTDGNTEEFPGPESVPSGVDVILIGAFGGLETGWPSQAWRTLLKALRQRARNLVCLPVRPLHGLPGGTYPLDGPPGTELETLLAALSLAWLPGPRQLRRLRHALPGARLADELLAFNDPAVERDGGWLVAPETVLMQRLSAFRALPEATKRELQSLVESEAWQASLHPTVQQIERLQQVLPEGPRSSDFPLLMNLAARSKADSTQTGNAFRLIYSLLPLAVALADSPVAAQWRPFLDETQRVASTTGQALPLGHHGLNSHEPVQWLRQENDTLTVSDQAEMAVMPLGPRPYCPANRRILAPVTRPNSTEMEIIDQKHRWHLENITRPNWANRIWRNRDGLFAAHQQGLVMRYREASPRHREGEWQVADNPWPWAAELGVDEYGLWAVVRVNRASQRMRWIPPGRFWMGSPENEPDRFDNENLHEVVLSQGFWLGETTCTNAFWGAVMEETAGDDPTLPKAWISWDDCVRFTQRLLERVPGLQWALPTEAQWEYACRAGTRTAYWWGDEFNGEFANNGDSLKPENAMPANEFGLRSMSGNVWEWCADRRGPYPEGPVTDPAGSADGPQRVLRGSSWFDVGRFLRSAYRDGFGPGTRDRYAGLRLAGGLDPQASQGARRMSADRWARSDQRGSAHAAGEGREKR